MMIARTEKQDKPVVGHRDKTFSPGTAAWMFACIVVASMQGIRFGSQPTHGGLWCSLLCGVSLGTSLLPLVCWLPVFSGLASRNDEYHFWKLDGIRFLLRRLLGGSKRREYSSDLFWLTAAWGLWCAASMVSVLAADASGVGVRAVAEVVLVGVSFLGLVLGLQRVPSACRSSSVAAGIVSGVAMLAALGALEMLLPRFAIFEILRTEPSRSVFPRVAGIMTWPNTYALILVVGLILGYCLLEAGLRTPIQRRARIAVLSVQLLLLVQLAATGSRSVWLVFLLGSAVLWALHRQRRLLMSAVAVLVVVAALVPVSARQLGFKAPALPGLVRWLPASGLSDEEFAVLAQGRSPEEVVDPKSTSVARSYSGRRELWIAALEALEVKPLTGIGAGAFESTIGVRVGRRIGLNAHSLPLNVAAETGLLGVLSCVLVLVAFVRPSWLRRNRNSLKTPAQGTEMFAVLGAERWGAEYTYWWVALGALSVAQLVDCLTYDTVVVAVWCIVAAQVWCMGDVGPLRKIQGR